MAFADVPAFLTCLHTRQSVAALALEFAVLTVARTNEVLGAKWGEIDTENSVWTVPACRMKAGARIASRYPGAPPFWQNSPRPRPGISSFLVSNRADIFQASK
jgi:hypothetical protein